MRIKLAWPLALILTTISPATLPDERICPLGVETIAILDSAKVLAESEYGRDYLAVKRRNTQYADLKTEIERINIIAKRMMDEYKQQSDPASRLIMMKDLDTNRDDMREIVEQMRVMETSWIKSLYKEVKPVYVETVETVMTSKKLRILKTPQDKLSKCWTSINIEDDVSALLSKRLKQRAKQ